MNDIESASDGQLRFVFACDVGAALKRCIDHQTAEAYVLRNGVDILYIGVSVDAVDRVLGHLGFSTTLAWPGQGDMLSFILDNRPASRDWQFQFYSLQPCATGGDLCSVRIVGSGFNRRSRCRSCLEQVESRLIRQFNPTLNAMHRTELSPTVNSYIDSRDEVIDLDEFDL